jgi:hypothetical protein
MRPHFCGQRGKYTSLNNTQVLFTIFLSLTFLRQDGMVLLDEGRQIYKRNTKAHGQECYESSTWPGSSRFQTEVSRKQKMASETICEA